MKKVLYSVFITLYALIAVFTTVCLLSYNDFKITQFGDYSLVIISDDNKGENFENGDLVVLNKKGKYEVGSPAFYYNNYEKEIHVVSGKVTNIEKITDTENTYTMDGDRPVSGQYVLGPVNGAIKVSGVGTVLSVLESKWGFLFLIVFPSLLAFIYEITVVVSEMRNSKQSKKEK